MDPRRREAATPPQAFCQQRCSRGASDRHCLNECDHVEEHGGPHLCQACEEVQNDDERRDFFFYNLN